LPSWARFPAFLTFLWLLKREGKFAPVHRLDFPSLMEQTASND
jgi:hypothetical protein